MPTSLQKTRKQIAKKRGGQVNALHGKSRDSLRLRQASIRDMRLEKLAAARSKKEQPIANRVAFFQESLSENDDKPLSLDQARASIQDFIHQYDEEYEELKKARRTGRPPSAREDLLKLKIASLETEYKNGFVLPDVLTADSAKSLLEWDGNWAYLTTLNWIKLPSEGDPRPAQFPSKGIN